MDLARIYIPIDRQQALAAGHPLPDRTTGAALFADISGSTPLTTALLKELGLKRGPEEMTRQLNRVYDALVNQVHRHGGSVLGFAGDAITCWFDGDDSRRAVACGLAMQQAMQLFASVHTPAGTKIPLGIKAAVAAGPVRRFLVGDPAIQYVDALAGATLGRMATAEHLARRGEVVVAPEVVANLGDMLTVAERRTDPDSGLQSAVVSGLTAPVTPTPWPAISPQRQLSQEQLRPWLLQPVVERLASGQGQFLAEIRPAAALFLRFGGIEFDTDDEAGDKLDAYIRWVQGILTRYEGNLLQLTIGDKGCYLYAAFGAPITHGDDPARATAAALALQSPPPRLAFVEAPQIGISQGRMRTGAYGGQTRRTYGVLGDEVNMAARLMQLAPPGQIMVSRPIATAVSENYQLADLGPTHVKGKAEPIAVYRVLGRRRQTARRLASLFANPLLGRDAELLQLTQTLEAAGRRQGQIVRVQGVAGIGKSHLVAEFAQRALRQGWRVVLGACQSTSTDISYHPWRQIFRALLVLLDDAQADNDAQIEQVTQTIIELNPAWQVRLPLLGDLLNLPIPDNPTTAAFEPQLRHEALVTFAVDLLRVWAQQQPLLLIVEDVHWLDESSRELLLALARVTDEMPLALTVVHRPPLDKNKPILPALDYLFGTHFLDLAELAPAGVAGLVTFKLQGQPSPLLLELVQTQALGNPFFAEELVDALRTLGHLRQLDDGQWDLSPSIVAALRRANCLTTDTQGQPVLNPAVPLSAADLGLPDSIQGLVLARLDRLLEEQKLTIKVASVIGRVFQFQLLARAHPARPDEATLLGQVEEIEKRGFVRLEIPPPLLTHIFKHNITRDVAYETLLESQQQKLHLAVARAIEADGDDAVELLAYHYNRAKVADKAMLFLDLAARKAQRDYANETALTYYRQALAWAERWEWRVGEFEVLHLLGRREEELEVLQRLETLPHTPPFELAYLRGQYYEAIADYALAQAALERALEVAAARQDSLRQAQALSTLGLIARRQGQYEQAQHRFMAVLTLFSAREEYGVDEERVLSEALNGLGIILRQQGEFEQARLYYNWALTLNRSHQNQRGEAVVLNSLGVTAFYQRRLDEAKSYYQQALEIQHKIGDRSGVSSSLTNLATAIRNAGDFDQAQPYYEEALAIQRALKNRWEEVNTLNSLGVSFQELGIYVKSEDYLTQAVKLAREIGDEIGVAYLLDNLSLVALETQDLVTAAYYQREGLEIATRYNESHLVTNYLYHIGMTQLRLGNFEQAKNYALDSLRLRQNLQMHLSTSGNLALLGKIYAALRDINQAVDYATQALSVLDGCHGEGPEFPQLDYFLCYQVFLAAGQTTSAQSALKAAHHLVITRAEKITQPSLRHSFLENVHTNREVMAAYRSMNDELPDRK